MKSQSEAWKRGGGLLLAILLLLVAAVIWGVMDNSNGKNSTLKDGKDLALLLAPYVVLATGIERFWEAVFSWYESFALSVGRLLGAAFGVTGWAGKEVENAEKVVSEAAASLGGLKPTDDGYAAALKTFQEAETRLLDAQNRIAAALKAPEYVALKRAITLLGSLAIGIAVAVGGRLMMLQAAGFPVANFLDSLITGLLIGAGPGPLHSFITALQELRNALAGVADLARGTALKRVQEAFPQPSTPARSVRSAVLVAPELPGLTDGDGQPRALTPGRSESAAVPSQQAAVEDLRLQRVANRLFADR